MNGAIWQVRPPSAEADELARALDIPAALARVLVNRKIVTEDAAREFLFGDGRKLHDPYLMKGMDKAVARIGQAIDRGEKILIFGDYDVDGVLSTVMLKKALTTLGAKVEYFIPERLTDGYGIKDEHVRIPVERGASLVISVDCGIKSGEFVTRAREQGVDVIITDHHRPGETLPDAVAVLDPILPESGYPDPGLAGVGVTFKLVQALLAKAGRETGLPHYMKLVAIGTVADVAELKGENRLFVKQGLKGLRDVSNPGLRMLIEASGLGRRAITEGDLGFRIGPRINAAGRMGMTDFAVKLFFSEDPAETLALVQKLDELNSQRQKTEEKIFTEACGRIEERELDRKYKCLVLGSPDWHRGVIGIVASKLKDRFNRPVILFHYENGQAHGSGRSIPEVPLIDLLESCKGHFLSYGGHKLAVGCTLPTADMAAFRATLNPLAESSISEDNLKKKLRIDAPLEFAAVDERFMATYALLVPFGVGNPKPLFMADNVEVVSEPQVLKGKHLKFLGRQDGRVLEVLGWDKAEYRHILRRGSRVSLAFSIMTSEYLGVPKTNLSIEDLRV